MLSKRNLILLYLSNSHKTNRLLSSSASLSVPKCTKKSWLTLKRWFNDTSLHLRHLLRQKLLFCLLNRFMKNWLSRSTLCKCSFNSFWSFVAKLHRRHFIISFSLVFYKNRERGWRVKKLLNLSMTKVCQNVRNSCRTTFLCFIRQKELQPGEFKYVNMKVAVQMPEEIVAVGTLFQHSAKMGSNWRTFNISRQTITFVTPINLSTYRGKCTLIRWTEAQAELFLQYSKTKNSCSSLCWMREWTN